MILSKTFSIGDKVMIKENGMIGNIIDTYEANGKIFYMVEGGKNDRYEGAWPSSDSPYPEFDCSDDEIELVK